LIFSTMRLSNGAIKPIYQDFLKIKTIILLSK
jgi:hypothetical protein